MMKIATRLGLAALLCAGLQACVSSETTVKHAGYTEIRYSRTSPFLSNTDVVLGYNPASGVSILREKGLPFKDLNRNGMLDPYEDWRLTDEERATDLASRMSVEQIAGLMLYSLHQPIMDSCLTDAQRQFLTEDNLRHVLITKVASARTAAVWNNRLQAYLEGIDLGIPSNNSSDPRNYTEPDGEYNAGSGGDISHWPREIGLGATFDTALIRRHAEVCSREYRALGICTALSPQVDIATDPRWRRFYGTFSEDPKLNTDIAIAYVDGFQSSYGTDERHDGWGWQSVNAMVKHWPGGGAGEAGRDAHHSIGKYAVYPGGGFNLHKQPFAEGAFRLPGKTKMASAVMPYYTVSWNQDPSGKNVANGFSEYIIGELLRKEQHYDGVVCTDWGIVSDYSNVRNNAGKPWGVEHYSLAERHYLVLRAGCDQFGGVNDKEPIVAAYHIWAEKHGEESARERFEMSARRLLLNIFRVGLFENPYVSPEVAEEVVGSEAFMREGYEAQLRSIVMLKNHNHALPLRGENLKVYAPKRHIPSHYDFWSFYTEPRDEYSVDTTLLNHYFTFVSNPAEADFALVEIDSPIDKFGYDQELAAAGKYAYIPITLQYEDYTATNAREEVIADGGDPLESFTNRSYQGRSAHAYNKCDMELVRETRRLMGNKPLILAVNVERPMVFSEVEPYADAVFCLFGVSNQALLDIVSGKAEPSALLPMQMPLNMQTVEAQCEDLPGDMDCYVDADGNTYDFAFGLNWQGPIADWRTERYKR